MSGKPQAPPAERFAALQGQPDENGCRPWLGYVKDTGHGRFNWGGDVGIVGAHVAAWLLAGGEKPNPGYTVDHQCHNRDLTCAGGTTCRHRRCTEATHLRVVTRQENAAAGRHPDRRRETCDLGHPIVLVGRRQQRICATCQRVRARAWRQNRRAAGLPAT